MSEITKLYENAGIKPTHYDACALEDKYWNNEELANQYGTFDGYLSFECPHHGEGCYSTCEYAYDKDEYPPFTPEKQLEIEKVILTKKYRKISYYIIDDDYSITFYHDTTNNDIPPFITWAKTRENVFADLINYIWQDLSKEEKQQVKGILE